MTQYVKLIEGELEYPPVNICRNGQWVCNYNLEDNYIMLLEDGWKPLIEAEKPEEEYTVSYEEEEDAIYEIIHILTPEEIAEREDQRIAKLTCTKRVFALILSQIGIPYSTLKEKIAKNERAQLEWDLCIELERSNPLIDQMALEFGFTHEMVNGIFKLANGEITSEELLALRNAE